MQEIRKRRLDQLLGFEYFRLTHPVADDCSVHRAKAGIAFRTTTYEPLLRDLLVAECRCFHHTYGLSRISLRLALEDGKVAEAQE